MSDRIHCPRRQLDCAMTDCVADYERVKARGTQPWRSDWHCQGCAEGAARSGIALEHVNSQMAVDLARQICSRCHRSAVRYIRDRLCPSCDARDREMQRGVNGKGTFPKELVARWQPHQEKVIVYLDSGWVTQCIEHTSGPLESLLFLIRRTRNPGLLVARRGQGYAGSR